MSSAFDLAGGGDALVRLNSRRLLLRALLARPDLAVPAWHALQSRRDVPTPDAALWRVLPLLHARLLGPGAMLEPASAPDTKALARAAATAFEQTRYRNAMLLSAAEDAVAVLARAGIPVAILKGAALVNLAYADPALRPMSDADLLVRPADVERALLSLRAAGWQGSFEATPLSLARCHSTPLTTAALGSVDLHWRAFDGNSCSGDDAALWEQATDVRFGATMVKLPSREALFVQACLAGTRFEGEASWRWMADAAALAVGAPQGAFDWGRAEDEACRVAEPGAVADAIEALAVELEADAPSDLVARLRGVRVPWTPRTASLARRLAPEARSVGHALALHLDGHRRLARLGGLPATPAGFVRSVALTWNVADVRRLPVELLRRGSARVPGLAHWRRFRQRPKEERRVLRRLAPLLAICRAALFVSGVPRARAVSLWLAPVTTLDPVSVESLCATAAARLAGRTPCLPRAIVCEAVLRASGLSAELRIGVAPRPRTGVVDAHAWVEVNGRALDPGAASYTALPLFGARG